MLKCISKSALRAGDGQSLEAAVEIMACQLLQPTEFRGAEESSVCYRQEQRLSD